MSGYVDWHAFLDKISRMRIVGGQLDGRDSLTVSCPDCEYLVCVTDSGEAFADDLVATIAGHDCSDDAATVILIDPLNDDSEFTDEDRSHMGPVEKGEGPPAPEELTEMTDEVEAHLLRGLQEMETYLQQQAEREGHGETP